MAEPWPAAVSTDAIVDTYDETPGETAIRSDMETGAAKSRQRFTGAIDKLVFDVPLDSRAEVQALLDFHSQTLKGGSLPFTRPHPRTLATVTCRFLKAPKPRPESQASWLGRVELEVLP